MAVRRQAVDTLVAAAVLLDRQVAAVGGSVKLRSIWKLGMTTKMRLSADVRTGEAPGASWARAEVWDGVRWSEVAELLPSRITAYDLLLEAREPALAFEHDENQLLRLTALVLEG